MGKRLHFNRAFDSNFHYRAFGGNAFSQFYERQGKGQGRDQKTRSFGN